jgi:hypothetical protein
MGSTFSWNLRGSGFKLHSDAYHINTRQKYNFHQLSSNLSLYQKAVYSTCIKVFNSLPQNTKNLNNNPQQSKSTPKNYAYGHTFYSVEEYYNVNRE